MRTTNSRSNEKEAQEGTWHFSTKGHHLVAIDPGKNSGGLAIWGSEDGAVACCNMPETLSDLKKLMLPLAIRPVFVWLERTGTWRPGQSAPAMMKFSRHCGQLEGLLSGLAMPFDEVSPVLWQRILGALPKDKAERKNSIKESMQRRYPHCNVTLRTADALGILTWALVTKQPMPEYVGGYTSSENDSSSYTLTITEQTANSDNNTL